MKAFSTNILTSSRPRATSSSAFAKEALGLEDDSGVPLVEQGDSSLIVFANTLELVALGLELAKVLSEKALLIHHLPEISL